MITRRGLFEAAVGAVAFGSSGALAAPAASTPGQDDALLWLSPLLPAGTRAEAALETLAAKKPLIRLTERPPNYEAPLSYLRTPITPNDEFFVRYHLAGIPQVDTSTWTLSIGGEAANGDVTIGLDELKRLPSFEVTAVCQCAGNRRGLFQPHVPGVQWGYGAMGCAKWKGARLKDLLDLIGLNTDAVEVVFDGADGPSGIAWDGGYGISAVETSADGGKSWTEAALGEELGKYAFRAWSHKFVPKQREKLSFAARATNRIGQTQTSEPVQNPAGYHHNAVQTVTLDVV